MTHAHIRYIRILFEYMLRTERGTYGPSVGLAVGVGVGARVGAGVGVGVEKGLVNVPPLGPHVSEGKTL